ncbi:glutamate-cysteine ligase family protein [soil metagenome]
MTTPLHLFEAFGIEVETMVVRADSLAVAPAAPWFLERAAGQPGASDAEWAAVTWSNELVSHVLELKTTVPEPGFAPAAEAMALAAQRADRMLGECGARLLPGGAHPWMDPAAETVLWAGDYSEVYQSYHRLFDCRQHGWANLQSCHLNLPFCGDEEFGRLHAAARLILPILPALCASTPYLDGKRSRFLDARLDTYRLNQARFPALSGDVIPEPVFTEETYRAQVLSPVREAVAAHDPSGLLEADFLNSRGAIARFDRGSVEIRLMDAQECPRADVALCALVSAVLREMVGERWSTWEDQKRVGTAPLVAILDRTIREAEGAAIDDAQFLRQFGISDPLPAGALWSVLHGAVAPELAEISAEIIASGSLATRLAASASRGGMAAAYARLADCIRDDHLFLP